MLPCFEITFCGFVIELRNVILECDNIKTTWCGTISMVTNNTLKERAKIDHQLIKNEQLAMQWPGQWNLLTKLVIHCKISDLKKLKKEERVDFGNEQRYYSCKCSDIYCKCTCPNKYVTANKASSSVLIAILNTLLFVGMNVLEGIVNGEKV